MQLSYLFFNESCSHSQTLSFLDRRNNKCVFGIIYFIGLFCLKNNLDNNMVLSYFIHLPKKIKLVYKIYQTEAKLKCYINWISDILRNKYKLCSPPHIFGWCDNHSINISVCGV